jgi:flagellar motor switch protein FliN
MKIESNLQPQAVDLLELSEPEGGESSPGPALRDARVLYEVPVTLEVVVGEAHLDVKTLFDSKVGTVLTLERSLGDAVEVRLNRRLVARGVLVAVGDQFGVRITEMPEAP